MKNFIVIYILLHVQQISICQNRGDFSPNELNGYNMFVSSELHSSSRGHFLRQKGESPIQIFAQQEPIRITETKILFNGDKSSFSYSIIKGQIISMKNNIKIPIVTSIDSGTNQTKLLFSNYEIQIKLNGSWYCLTGNLSQEVFDELKIKKYNCSYYEFRFFEENSATRQIARAVFKIKGELFYSNEFYLYLTPLQIEHSKKYYNWEE